MVSIRAKCAIDAIFMPVAICVFGDARDGETRGKRMEDSRMVIAVALCSNMVH